MSNGTESFRDVWSATIWPVIQQDYEDLLRTLPTRMKQRSEKKEKEKKEKEKEEAEKKKKKERKHKKEKKDHETIAEEEEEVATEDEIVTFESAEESKGSDELKKKDANVLHDKMSGILQEVKQKGERRNAYLNLAFTGPADNSPLQANMPFAKVVNCALDMFCDCSQSQAQDSKVASDPGNAEGSEKKCTPAVLPGRTRGC